ncbi:LCP family protein [Saccharothrix xinjiangensis]|uniref:LCP family protein n=1 Tax=Saccharothrix xinjiangensis TaxID=204798 RepID=A0ABV9XXN4_9PSEU
MSDQDRSGPRPRPADVPRPADAPRVDRGRPAAGRGQPDPRAGGVERGGAEQDGVERGGRAAGPRGDVAGGRAAPRRVNPRAGAPRARTESESTARIDGDAAERVDAAGRAPAPANAGRVVARSGGVAAPKARAEDIRRARAAAVEPEERPRPAPVRTGPPRRRPPERARAGSVVGRAVLALFSTSVLLGTGYGWANYQQLSKNLSTTDVISDAGGGEKPADGSIDILMVGMDSRTDAKGNPLPQEVLNELQAGDESAGGLNTDTIILMHVPNDGGKAVAVSFPRDSYVKIAGGYGRHKINSAYGYGKNEGLEELKGEGVSDAAQLETGSRQYGAKTLIGTVEDLTGVTVDHYAEVNLVGFYEITKAIGGVEVCLNQATQDEFSGANFQAGQQRIQGRDALAFVRQRHGLLRGDLDRIVRQQVFMAGLAKQVLSAGTLSDPGRLGDLIDALTKSIVLDEGWDVLQFANQMKNLTGGNLRFETIPTGTLTLETPEDGLAVEVKEREVAKFFDSLNSGPNTPVGTTTSVDPATVAVEVYNASGVGGLASRVLQSLVAEGFVDGGTGNAPFEEVSVVRHGAGGEAAAEAVADVLGVDVEQDDEVPAGRTRVVVGSDYTGPGAQGFASGPLVGLDGARRQPTTTDTTTEQPITADGVRCVN